MAVYKMPHFETDPPHLEPLDSAVIARVTDAERQYIGTMARLWEMSVSEFVRHAAIRYTQQVLERAANMTLADIAIEESRHVKRAPRETAEAAAE